MEVLIQKIDTLNPLAVLQLAIAVHLDVLQVKDSLLFFLGGGGGGANNLKKEKMNYFPLSTPADVFV